MMYLKTIILSPIVVSESKRMVDLGLAGRADSWCWIDPPHQASIS